MLHKKDDTTYLWDMLDAAQTAQEFICGRTFHEFQGDKILKRARERQIEIIGEAANHVSASLRSSYPSIPWERIIGQRHFLAHEYGEIEYERLWLVVVEDIPKLVEKLKPLLPAAPPEVDL